MFQRFPNQSIAVGAGAALIVSWMALLAPTLPAVAKVDAEGAVQKILAKGDRLPKLVTGSPCSAQSWPSFDQKCQFDLRRSVDEVRQVRVVSLIRR